MPDPTPDDRLDFPATHRNREAILRVLARVMPARGRVLEVASGSGQHLAAFAPHFPEVSFVPTDLDPRHVASADAWCHALPNVEPARRLDVRDPWPVGGLDGVLCANMIHIAPWSCAEGLMAGAGGALVPGGWLALYGPFHVGGKPTSPSNADFDASLRARDPSWGVRNQEDVVACAGGVGLHLEAVLPMPANNQTLLFRVPSDG